MKVKLLTLVAAMFVLAATAFAQPASVAWYIYNFDTNAPVVYRDCAADPVPDGWAIGFFWDLNGNGPDDQDALLPLWHDGDPIIAGGANYNSDVMNGMEQLGVPGTYVSLTNLTVPLLPATPRIYLKIYCENGDVNQVSQVFTLAPGPADLFVLDWTCSECGGVVPCIPDDQVVLVPSDTNFPAPQTTTACAHIGDQSATTIVVPVTNASNVPTVTVTPGCADDPTCVPATDWTLGQWTFGDNPPHYWNTITRVGDGCCVTLHLDYIQPVSGLTFSAIARDNSVDLAWSTITETNLARFVVTRDGTPITQVAAHNSPAGSNYSFTDKTAANGTTYNYTIVAINIDGSQAGTQTVEGVTPSANKALVTEYALHQNYPNPFNPSTSIRFDLVDANYVTLKVFNATGQEVATLVNGNMPKGVNLVNFDASNLTSGLYFYTVKVGNVYSATKKMLLVK